MTTSTPDWLQNFKPQPGRGNWVKGKSGNPAGRPPGIVDKRQRISQAFMDDAHDIAKKVVEAALKGDLQAANIVLSRVQPVLKARGEKVMFALDTKGSLLGQAEQVLQAIANAELEPDVGKSLLESLGSFAGLRQMDELAERIAKLEQRGDATIPGARGGVVSLSPQELEQLPR